MAWMTMMGANSVDYHRATIVERGDDHPGQALEYYGSRGETPLVWGGSGAPRLGLSGTVTDAQYTALFAVGGAQDPTTEARLVETRRPGMELVVSANKSVAELGVIGHAGMMHAILDAERDATMGYLDGVTRERGGRRGRQRAQTATGGLIYAHTRHATSRAGDPCPHDHVLVANLVEMADPSGGWKAADTALWRDELHAATMVGRLAAARTAVEAGLAIEADTGPSGQLRHWRIAGIPNAVLEVHSKRAAEIDEHLEGRGFSSARARGVAARETRKAKRFFEPVGELMGRWRGELAETGWPVARLRDSIEVAGRDAPVLGPLSTVELAELTGRVIDGDSELARLKVFGRAQVIVAVAPLLFGRPVSDLDRMVGAVLANVEVVPLVGVAGARDRQYTLAGTIATELAIASLVAEGAATSAVGVLAEVSVAGAVARVEGRLGRPLTTGQAEAVSGICGQGQQVSLVLGVAGSGKTTCLAAVADAYQSAGYRVVGTATSGQAARTLAREADVVESRTVASLLWRIDHGRLRLDANTVVIVDEVGMTDDPNLLKVLAAANAGGAKAVLVGDDRQLSPVGPGGALGALLDRHHAGVHVLAENIRQTDRAERQALAELRAGDIDQAVAWYRGAGRIRPASDLDAAVVALVKEWAADVKDGSESVILAWRRGSVEQLNRQARLAWANMGRLAGPVLQAPGGRCFQAGDLVVALAPAADPTVVTSQRGRVRQVDPETKAMVVQLDDGRDVRLTGEQLAADRLAHSYALTVHRSQGLTVGTCHHLADGGGRELAYVAMSRARTATSVHVVADDVDQAADDLARHWARDTRARWAVDTGTPGPHPAGTLMFSPEAARQLAHQARQARLRAERDALQAAIPADVSGPLAAVEARHRQAADRLDQLRQGRYQGDNRALIEAANRLRTAANQRAMAEQVLSYPNLGWRTNRIWKRDLARFTEAEQQANGAWQQAAAPEIKELSVSVCQMERTRTVLRNSARVRSDWLAQHPEAYERLGTINELIGAQENQEVVPGRRGFSRDLTPSGPTVPAPAADHAIQHHQQTVAIQQQLHPNHGIEIGL